MYMDSVFTCTCIITLILWDERKGEEGHPPPSLLVST